MCRLLLVTVACLMVLFGISGLWMMPKLIQQKIEQRMQLKIGTKSYERFTKVPIPLTVKFYLFNVTNSERVLQGHERPQFQEVGPFVYKQWRRREVVDILDHNRKLIYKEFKTYYPTFQQQVSRPAGGAAAGLASSSSDARHNGEQSTIRPGASGKHNGANDIEAPSGAAPPPPPLLDPSQYNITIVNLPLLSALTQLAQLEGSLKRQFLAKVVSQLLQKRQDKILITKPANQLLFDGYKVDLMESAKDLISNTFGFNFESPLPQNKFGFFHMKNGTWTRRDNGELTVFTGRNNSMDDFMIVDNWNGLRQLKVWPTDTEAGNRCNEIRGTDGSQFHPGITRQQVLSIFSPMICTSIFIKYKEDTSARDIPLLRFTTPPDVFAAPKKNPRNACYCTIPAPAGAGQSRATTKGRSRLTDGRCYIDGLMDLSLCQGAPIAVSSPHFYNADPMLAMAAGLKPNKERHETYLDIEPMTGAVFRAASRGQLNALVEQAALEVVDSRLIGHMAPMVAPLFWFEESAEIDDKSATEFKGQLLNLVQRAKKTFYYSIALGVLLALLVGLQWWYVTCYWVDKGGAKRRLAAEDERRGRKLGRNKRQYETNLRLAAAGGDARRSNLANRSGQLEACKPLVGPARQGGAQEEPAVSSKALPLVAVTGALGATDLRRAQRERRRNRRADYEADESEEELSKRKLVENEWQLGGATHSSTSNSDGHSGQALGCGRADENLAQRISDLSAGSGGGGASN